MAQTPEEKPWFGKRCTKCNAPINYAYKGVIAGWCGKCTDEVRRIFRDDLARELAGSSGANTLAPSSGGGGKLVLGLVLGLALGAGAAAGAAAYAPAAWAQVVGALAPAKGP